MADENRPWWASTYWLMEREALEALVQSAPKGASPRAAGLVDGGGNQEPYRIENGVAVIDVVGPLSPRPDFWTWLLGTTDYETLAAAVQRADRDARAQSIRLAMDSPGGASSGISVALRAIEGVRKPIEAHVTGLCASAAYWLAAATGRIKADPAAVVGSVGVYMAVASSTGKPGGPVVFVSSQSPKKNAPPESEDGRGQYQTLVDDLCVAFMTDVARLRGTTFDTVAADYGNGAVMAASRALTQGLIDEVLTHKKENGMGHQSKDQKGGGVFAALRTQLEDALKVPEGDSKLAAFVTGFKEQLGKVFTAGEQTEAKVEALEAKLNATPPAPVTPTASPAQSSPAAAAAQGSTVQAGETLEFYRAELAKLRDQVTQLEAARAADKKTVAIEGLLKSGRISPAERPQAERAWDLDQQFFADAYAGRRPGHSVPLHEVGHPGDPPAGSATKETIATACRAMADKEKISFEAALDRFERENPAEYAAVYGRKG